MSFFTFTIIINDDGSEVITFGDGNDLIIDFSGDSIIGSVKAESRF